jgi:F-type H+-transporting ATPase subunit gamma
LSKIKEIKNRIKSVRDVQQITRAMKMVAAARLRKSESRLEGCRRYCSDVCSRVEFIVRKNRWADSFFLKPGRSGRTGILVLSGDKGLCGAFNHNVLRRALGEIRRRGEESVRVFGVGKKGNYLLRREGFELGMNVSGIFGKVDYPAVMPLASDLLSAFRSGEIRELWAVFNRYKPKGRDPVGVEPILPVPIPEGEPGEEPDYDYEPGVEAVLERLLPYYFTLSVYSRIVESEAAEFLARMTAMDAASDNASELIGRLTLDYNRARQATITKEILDIVGGAEALK